MVTERTTRYILQKLGISLQQKNNPSPGNRNNSISAIEIEKNILKWIFKKYPHLCTRLGKSKNHIAKSIFKQNHTTNQQTGCRVPLHLLEKVENELDKLIEVKQITKLEKFPDDLFLSSEFRTVKKDKTVQIALDSKKLNKAVHKKIPNAKHRPYSRCSSSLYNTKRIPRDILVLQNRSKIGI